MGDSDSTPDGSVPSDIDVAQNATLRPIADVGADLGLDEDDLEQHGDGVAKLTWDAINRTQRQPTDGRLVLVTAMTPTRRGAGKTVTTVGLGQALNQLGRSGVVAVREPSQGPVFGIKGGAAGGGYSQVLPMERINLHFTGDIHAVTAAHNLVAAMIDGERTHGNDLDIEPDSVVWGRALDVNDRALRNTVIGLGGSTNGPPREDSFLITAASELMAVLCLSTDLADLKQRVSRIIVAYNTDGDPITIDDLDATGAVAALLKDALQPNLVQTIEGTPAFVHGGPFANIATGTNSILANKVGLTLGDYLVTEAGFGADLGAEKFVNIVSRHGLAPDASVVVATIDALNKHGKEAEDVADNDASDDGRSLDRIRAGCANLDHHVDNLRAMGLPVVVAINRFPDDTDEEIQAVLDHCADRGVPVAVSTLHRDGGEGGIELAEAVVSAAESNEQELKRTYDPSAPIEEKVRAVATEVYGADGVTFTSQARDDIQQLTSLGLDDLPVCMSKTPSSLSDDPSATDIEVDDDGSISGLF